MSTLVTGGSGFLGRYLVEQLVARGETIRVFCRSEPECLSLPGVTWLQGDVRDAESVTRACRDMSTIFHCAALPGIWGPWSLYENINTHGTLTLLSAAADAGAARFVYTSSPSVIFDGSDMVDADESRPYPDRFLCGYPRSKALAEAAVLAANGKQNLATVALRPHLIWGPRDNHLLPTLVQKARHGRLRRVGDGHNVISTVYVENAAAAHLQAADLLNPDAPHAGNAYFINEPETVNLWKWINQLLELAELPTVSRSISAPAARRLGGALEWIWRILPLKGDPPMTRFLAEQLARSHSFSIEAAVRDFGYRRIVTAEEGLRRVTPYLQALGQSPSSDT